MDTFGEWLREQRSQRKLTRQEFAQRVGCSVAMLRKIEDGERRPSAQIAELMANCLNLPLQEHSTFVRVARRELSVDRLRPSTQPAASSNVSSPKATLPVFPTPLIGRARELASLSQLLGDPQCRLLTLVGPGGMGKTRLAIEIALDLQQSFADGAYFVPFVSASSPRFIVPVIADAIGFPFQHAGHADPKTQLFGYLQKKQVLLLLDNLEQLLIEPGIELLAELLVQAPQVKLLGTSRECLGLQQEWIFEVPGLPIPENMDAQGIEQNTSIELFLQRARRSHIGFHATPGDFPAIIRICHLVDGNPLGIELAAAWVRTLACGEIAQEIERGVGFLSVSMRDVPPRHRSMQAVFDHSWKLLTKEEQNVLMGLAVFRGGFRREAAEQVAGATLGVLASLVTKSFVRRSGTGRYDLHELIRLFAAEQFAGLRDEQTATQTRHGRYYLSYFSQADGRLRSSLQQEALQELTQEIDNFRAAWEWAVTQDEFGLIEQTLRMFMTLFDMRGWLQEGIDLLGRALTALETAHGQLPADRTDQLALGHILSARAVLATRLGQQEQARAMFERSLRLLRPLNEPGVLVEAITFFGILLEFMGNYARASEMYTEGLAIATSVGDRWFAALCLLLLAGEGSLRLPAASAEESHKRLQSVVADWCSIGDPRLTAIALNNLSWMAVRLGRYDEARPALEESILLNTSLDERWGLGFSYRGLGLIAQAQGEHVQAVEDFRKSLEMFREIGADQDMARVRVETSRSLLALGNDSEAERGWREALSITRQTQGTFVALEALAGLAALKARQGDNEKALTWSLLILNHPASLAETKDRADRLRAEVELRLTPERIETLRVEEKTFEVVVEEVLSQGKYDSLA